MVVRLHRAMYSIFLLHLPTEHLAYIARVVQRSQTTPMVTSPAMGAGKIETIRESVVDTFETRGPALSKDLGCELHDRGDDIDISCISNSQLMHVALSLSPSGPMS